MDKYKLSLSTALAGTLILAACGGDSGSETSNAAATATPTKVATATAVPSVTSTPVPVATATPSPTAPALVTATPVPTGSSSLIDAAHLDAGGGLAFSNTAALNYLVGTSPVSGSTTAYSLSGESASGAQFIYGYNNNVTDATTGLTTSVKYDSAASISTSTIAGALTVGKSSATANYANGGAVVFRLPSCTTMKLDTATTGDMYFRVEISTDSGASWVLKNAPTAKIRAKGTSTEDISSYVASAVPVWVRLTNGGTGGFNIQRVVIAP